MKRPMPVTQAAIAEAKAQAVRVTRPKPGTMQVQAVLKKEEKRLEGQMKEERVQQLRGQR